MGCVHSANALRGTMARGAPGGTHVIQGDGAGDNRVSNVDQSVDGNSIWHRSGQYRCSFRSEQNELQRQNHSSIDAAVVAGLRPTRTYNSGLTHTTP